MSSDSDKLADHEKELPEKTTSPQAILSIERIGKGLRVKQGGSLLTKELLQWQPERLN
jgi:hypothetical protein